MQNDFNRKYTLFIVMKSIISDPLPSPPPQAAQILDGISFRENISSFSASLLLTKMTCIAMHGDGWFSPVVNQAAPSTCRDRTVQ